MNQETLHQIIGPFMWPLWICSFVLLALVINRTRALNRSRIIDASLNQRVKELISKLDFAGAEAETQKSSTLIGRAWADGLREFQAGGLSITEALGNASGIALRPLKRNLNHIATIGVIAPMIGLIGTVVGMIITFATLAETGGVDKKELASGLAFALYKTAGGLIVAIPAIVAGRIFQGKIAAYAAETESAIQAVHYANVHARAQAEEAKK
jgi:biopolymer transport protein ExbB